MNSIAEVGGNKGLVENLEALVWAHRAAFRQERTYWRAVGLLLAEVFSFGRHTVTQLMLTLGLTDADWSASYRMFSRERFDVEVLARCLLRETLEHVAEEELYVVGTDGVQVPRSSHRMPGTGWLKAPRTPVFRMGIHRAQRFVHGCWFTPLANGFSRAVPLRWLAAFPEKAIPADEAPCREWEAGVRYVEWVRRELDQAGRAEQGMLWLADGTYDNIDLWKAAPDRVIAAIRTARNRALYAYLPPEERCGNRKYGPKAPAPKKWMEERKGGKTITILVRGQERRLRYRVLGPYVRRGVPDVPLFLVVVHGQTWYKGKQVRREQRREPVSYLVSAKREGEQWVFPLDISLLLTWLWQRWEMEVAHREMKSNLGLGEKQCWNTRSAIVSVQWNAWVYAVLILAGYRTWQLSPGPAPIARWSPRPKRWSFNTLWRTYRAEFWSLPHYRAIWTPIRTNWPNTEASIAGLWNAVAASARI
jgi:hypothetical protein